MAATPKPKAKVGGTRPGAGRPSKFTDEIADEICRRIAEGESLRAICRDDHMPDRNTVFSWEDANPDFSAKCARARIRQGDWLFEDMASIEAGVLSGKITSDQARVVIGSKQWRAGRLAPRKYGDKLIQEHTGPNGGPVEYRNLDKLTDDELRVLQAIQTKLGDGG